MSHRILATLVLTSFQCLLAQQADSTLRPASLQLRWLPQSSGTKASLRGLCAVDDNVAWASGTQGTFVRTTDGGKIWKADSILGAGALDFRDVEAFDANTAILMSAGSGELSRIYKTTDGGKSWKLCFRNTIAEGFFDGMAFWDEQIGILFGDPVGGKLFIMRTEDGGLTWNRVPPDSLPAVLPKEYAFAASGTSIAVQGRNNVWIATGGEAARVFSSKDTGKSWYVANTPIISGNESSGIFSLVFMDESRGVAVGGDYKNPGSATANAAQTFDGGDTWSLIQGSHPLGYRSCVAYAPGSLLPFAIAVGPTGSDFAVKSLGGPFWINFGADGYHTVSTSKRSRSVWAAGADGRIAKLNTDVASTLSRPASKK
jgi:photosystem II stability/assembly factor-like uncharacterized protein